MRSFKKIILGIAISTAVIVVLFVSLVFNPSPLFAKKTSFDNVTVYHQKLLNPKWASIIKNSVNLIKQTEIYDPNFRINLILNDGSPSANYILQKVIPKGAFGAAMYNTMVMRSVIDADSNIAELNDRTWKATSLIAHEMVHCFQDNAHGFDFSDKWNWKREGYAEYIANVNYGKLEKNITNLQERLNVEHDWWYYFEDGTAVGLRYFKASLLIQYLVEVKRMSYQEIVDTEETRENVEEEMYAWYNTYLIENVK